MGKTQEASVRGSTLCPRHSPPKGVPGLSGSPHRREDGMQAQQGCRGAAQPGYSAFLGPFFPPRPSLGDLPCTLSVPLVRLLV